MERERIQWAQWEIKVSWVEMRVLGVVYFFAGVTFLLFGVIQAWNPPVGFLSGDVLDVLLL